MLAGSGMATVLELSFDARVAEEPSSKKASLLRKFRLLRVRVLYSPL